MAVSKKASLLVILLVGIVGVVVKFLLDPFGGKEPQVAVKKDEVVVENVPTQSAKPVETTPAESATPAPVTAPTAAPAQATAKKLSLNTSYGSPAGPEEVGFVVTVDANGVIASAETIVKAADDKSINYQKSFQAGLPGAVVGKKLSDLTSIDKVGKASLTTNSFNASLAKLKSQM